LGGLVSLAELQELFWRAVSWPTGVADFLAQADDATVEAFHATFAETPQLSRVERVDIYAESYFWRLFETLQTQFPVTAWLAGEGEFRNMVTDYVLERPSQDPDLRRFGAALPSFLQAHAIAQERPWLPYCAQVELVMVGLLDAADRPPITIETLAQIPAAGWPELRFTAATTFALVASRWRYSPLLAAYRRGGSVADAPTAPSDAEVHTLIWRERMQVMHRSLGPAEAAGLAMMRSGGTFNELCAAAAAQGASTEAVAGWLRLWIEAELIVGLGPRRG